MNYHMINLQTIDRFREWEEEIVKTIHVNNYLIYILNTYYDFVNRVVYLLWIGFFFNNFEKVLGKVFRRSGWKNI